MNMSRRKVITNNMKVRDWSGFLASDEFVSGNASLVIVRCRDLIHLGWILLNHPMAGSLKPGENPYRTVILEKGEEDLDIESLSMIEVAIESARKFDDRWSALLVGDQADTDSRLERLRDDFMTVDFSLFRSAVER